MIFYIKLAKHKDMTSPEFWGIGKLFLENRKREKEQMGII